MKRSPVDVILTAEQSNEEMVIAALRARAWDYLKGPVFSDNVCDSVALDGCALPGPQAPGPRV